MVRMCSGLDVVVRLSVCLCLAVLLQVNCSLAEDEVVEMAVNDDVSSGEVIHATGEKEGEKEIEVPSGFSFSQCEDPKTLPIEIKKFTINPDPLVLPGIIKFKLTFKVKELITGPIRVKLLLERHTKEDGWASLPCNEDGQGSCDHDDVCPALVKLTSACPKEITKKGLTCTCPLKPGKYSFKTFKFPITTQLFEGALHVVARFMSQDGQTLACLDSTVVIKTGNEMSVEELRDQLHSK